jgi:hypothetical protein
MALITGINAYLTLGATRVAALGQWTVETTKAVKGEFHSDSGGCIDNGVGGYSWKGTFRANAGDGKMQSALQTAHRAGTVLAFIGNAATGTTWSSSQPAGTSIGHGVILTNSRTIHDVATGAVTATEWDFTGQGDFTPATV